MVVVSCFSRVVSVTVAFGILEGGKRSGLDHEGMVRGKVTEHKITQASSKWKSRKGEDQGSHTS